VRSRLITNTTLHWHTLHTGKILHPTIRILIHTSLDNALVARIRLLLLQASASRTHTALSIIHSLLERVVFPPKDVVPVLAVTRVVAGAEVEWLRAVCGPIGLVVELAGVPDNLGPISVSSLGVQKRVQLTSSMTWGMVTG
jgi:hypothetical protein